MLNDLKKSTSASDAVYEYWAYETSTLDSAFDTGDTKYFRGSNYYDKISTEGKLWIPFGDYRTSGDAVTTNPPGATKAVLEDGLLGDIQNSDVSGKLDFIAPTISDANEGSDVTLTFENGSDYLSKITALYLNGDWCELSSGYYTIQGNTITLKKDELTVGETSLKIVSAGYKAQEVKFTYNKATESGLSLSVADTTGGQPVVITINGSKGDFLKNLKSVVLTDQDNNKKTVSKQGVEGDTAIYYSIDENNTVIRLHNITKPGKYTLQLTADYYNELNTAFTMAGSLKKVPNATPHVSFANGIYSLDFGTVDFTWWNYVDSVTVNDKAYTQNSLLYSLSMLGDAEYGWFDSSYNSRILNLGASAFTEDQNTVVIRSTKDGYEDLTLTITKDGKLVVDNNNNGNSGDNSGGNTGDNNTENTLDATVEYCKFVDSPLWTDYYELKFSNPIGTELTTLINNISSVKVGSTEYTRASNVTEDSTFAPAGFNTWTAGAYDGLKLAANGFDTSGDTIITITTKDNKTLTCTVKTDGTIVQ